MTRAEELAQRNARDLAAMTTGFESFTAEFFERLAQPCVYMFMREGKPVYIGKSKQGIFRAGSPHHQRAPERATADEIKVFWFKKAWQASDMERRLIQQHNPPLNGARVGRSRE